MAGQPGEEPLLDAADHVTLGGAADSRAPAHGARGIARAITPRRAGTAAGTGQASRAVVAEVTQSSCDGVAVQISVWLSASDTYSDVPSGLIAN